MEAIVEAIAGLGGWSWLVLAVALMVLETIVPGVHFMWFGTAAAIVGAIMLAYPVPISIQLVSFAVLSLATIVAVRRYWASERVRSDVPDLNERGHQYVGRIVTVEDPIAQGRGKVRVADTVWIAEGPDSPAGVRVKVVGVKSTVLVVAPAGEQPV